MKITEHIRGKILNAPILLVLLFAIGTPVHANVNISPASVNFGNQSVGTTSAAANMTLTNAKRRKTTIVSISSSVAQFSYSWPSLPFTLGPGQQLTGTVAFTPAAPQIYKGTLTFTAANGLNIVVSLSGTGVQAQPLATVQPTSETVTTGQSASFSASASGVTPLGYQWKKNGTAISGATSATYTTPPATSSDNGAQFSVNVSTSTGSASSNPATLTVIVAVVTPSITTQPVSRTVIAGQTASFSVAATGTAPLSYQWKKSGTAIAGATSPTYGTPATATVDNGAQFTVVVSNSAGNVTSNAATLTVNPAPVAPSVTNQPASQTITAGQAASFSVAATGTAPLSYQWMKGGTPIAGATSSTYTIPVTTTSSTGSQFSITVSNSAGNVTSNAATLTVNAVPVAPAITTQPASQTVTAGQTASFSVAASGTAPLTYQWKKNGTPIAGATSATYSTPATSTSDNGAPFTVVVSNTAGNVTSDAASLTVNVPPGQLTASNSTVSFGSVTVGMGSSQSVTLTNSGNTDITIATISVFGPGFNASGVPSGLILAAGQIATLNVTFAPAASGTVTGSATITSNATSSVATISLSGSGVTQSSSAITAWVAPRLARVGPTDTPGTTSSVNISGARGEYADTQIIVTAPGGGLTNVNMSASNLTGPAGATIAASNIIFYREYYVTVTGSAPGGGTNPPLGSGTYPEPLIPFVDPETATALNGSLKAIPATVAANQNQPFWVDLSIPRGVGNCPPGTYTGTITVTSTQGNMNVPVTLTVWNFELPLASSEKSLFEMQSAGYATTAYEQSLLRNKIDPWYVTSAQAAAEVTNRTGLEYGGNNQFVNCDGTHGTLLTQAQVATLAAAMPAGLPTDFYVADENTGCTASYPVIQGIANNAHPSGVKILDTIAPVAALYGYVDYWVMLPGEWPGSLSGIPGSFWSYTSCNLGNGNPPSWQIDFPLLDERMDAGFLNQTQGATGLLYYQVDNWASGDAISSWTNLNATACGVSRPGDGLMIYPPSPIGSSEPAPGMRLKAIRDGMQDYEYVQILKNLGQGAFANSVIQPIATSWDIWTHDPNAIEAARIQLGQKLNQLSAQ